MKVRPITVMAGLAAVAALAAVTLAWLPGDDSTMVGQPSALPIVLGGGIRAEAATASTISGSTTYERGPGLADLTGTQAAWTFPAKPVDPWAIRRLADALGVAGEVRTVPGGWQVGADDAARLFVASAPGAAWYFSAGGDTAVAYSCAAAGEVTTIPDGEVPPPDRPSPPDVSTQSTPSTPTTSAEVAPPDCGGPPPPEGVPGAAAAESMAGQIIRSAGLDLDHAVMAVQAEAWSATVTATPVLDGTPTVGIDTTISFGGEAKVVYASGTLASPTTGDTYPLIGTDAAIDRLQRGVDLMGAVPVAMATMGSVDTMNAGPRSYSGSPDAAGSGATDSSPGDMTTETAPAPSPNTTYPPDTTVPAPDGTSPPCPQPAQTYPAAPPAPGDAGSTTTMTAPGSAADPGCAIPPCAPTPDGREICPNPYPDPHPGPTVVPDPSALVDQTVTITSAEVVLVATPGHDGSMWLVPAYRLTAGDSDLWIVLGIDESFIAPPSEVVPPGGSPPGVVPPGAAGGDSGSSSGGSVGEGNGETTPGFSPGCPPAGADPSVPHACPTIGVDAVPPTTGTIQPAPTGQG